MHTRTGPFYRIEIQPFEVKMKVPFLTLTVWVLQSEKSEDIHALHKSEDIHALHKKSEDIHALHKRAKRRARTSMPCHRRIVSFAADFIPAHRKYLTNLESALKN